MKLLTLKLLRVKFRLAHLPAILWFDSIWVEDSIKFSFHIFLVLIIFSKVERSFLFVLMILGCQLSVFGDITFHAESEGQFLRIILRQALLFALGVGDHKVEEQLHVYLLRTVAHSLCYLRL